MIKNKYLIFLVIFFSINLLYFYAYSHYEYIYYKNKFDSQLIVRFPERNMHLDNACFNHKRNNFGVTQYKHVLRNMFIDTVHNISWCPVYKAASSIWYKYFAQLGGALTDRTKEYLKNNLITWNALARQAFPQNPDINETYANFNKTNSFIIVRHPFDRILSMYLTAWDPNNKENNKNEIFVRSPTFNEFLFTLVNHYTYFDETWSPIYEQCSPCTLRYDYIIKTELFVNDTRCMIQELGLNKYLNFEFVETKETDFKTIANHFKSVQCEVLEDVYELYKDDFIFFHYSPSIHYQLCTN